MKYSWNWLKSFVDIDIEPEELANCLSMIGMEVESVSSSGNDYIFDIEITPNRGDCLSMLGLSREIAALLGKRVTLPPMTYAEKENKTDDLIQVKVEAPDLCPRYCGKVVKGVKIAPSPRWLVERLLAVGLRPINNVVDITNFVLAELGHPLHAFDLGSVQGHKVVVRRALAGEKISTIDGVERVLDSDMLAIADKQRPIAIAGVMGGVNSEITQQTTDIFIESACFDPRSIRRTSKKLNLSSDASFHFERGTDHQALTKAIDRACHLIQKLGTGEIYSGVIDIQPQPLQPRKTWLRSSRVDSLLGVKIEKRRVEDFLTRLNFELQRKDDDSWTVTIPTYRGDVEKEIDLIEEVARFYGYDRIPSTMPLWRGIDAGAPDWIERERLIRRIMIAAGYYEVINYSFVDDNIDRLFRTETEEAVKLQNPIAEQMGILRTSLLSSMISNLAWNINRGIKNIKIFEIGKVYHLAKGMKQPEERETLGIAATGNFAKRYWKDGERGFDFYDLKGVIELLFRRFGWETLSFVPDNIDFYHPARAAIIRFNHHPIGHIGMFHPQICAQLELSQEVYMAQLDLEPLLKAEASLVKFQPLPKFPAISRDISLLFDRDISFDAIARWINSLKEDIISEVKIYDLYHQGDNIPKDKVSISLNVQFRHPQRTLTLEEVARAQQRLINLLKEKLNAEPR
ncbi:phenylalanine--tRNA ligase subunit beta [bacterium (candidate division B38) B3_B38]|nr:MAG: phenylalanine--tRNA ligase subunit beta [bacterium (candidate division B38) B3_B38]